MDPVNPFPEENTQIEDKYLNINLKILYITGVWPKKGFIGRVSILALSIIVMFLIFFVGAIYEVYHGFKNFVVVTECLSVSILGAVTFQKYLTLIIYEKDFKQLVSLINNYFFMEDQRQTKEKYDIIQTQEKASRKLTMIFLFICMFTVTGFTLHPVVEGVFHIEEANSTTQYVWRFPYKISFPLDESDTLIYIMLYLYHGYLGLTHIFLIPAFDNFIVSLMCHIVAQLRVLKFSLENLYSDALKKLESINSGKGLGPMPMENGMTGALSMNILSRSLNTDDKSSSDEITLPLDMDNPLVTLEMDRLMKKCVVHHQMILKFAQMLENATNRVMLSQFFASSTMFCTSAFQLTTGTGNKVMQVITMGGLMSGALLQLGMYCYYGGQVKEESQAVATAAYSSLWYFATPAIKRSIIIIMRRSQKAAVLTIGKFVDLSLNTYTTVLKGSYTYFAMLNKLND